MVLVLQLFGHLNKLKTKWSSIQYFICIHLFLKTEPPKGLQQRLDPLHCKYLTAPVLANIIASKPFCSSKQSFFWVQFCGTPLDGKCMILMVSRPEQCSLWKRDGEVGANRLGQVEQSVSVAQMVSSFSTIWYLKCHWIHSSLYPLLCSPCQWQQHNHKAQSIQPQCFTVGQVLFSLNSVSFGSSNISLLTVTKEFYYNPIDPQDLFPRTLV